jgi:hypothetical protein
LGLNPVLRNPGPFGRDQVEKFDQVWILAGVQNQDLIQECYKARGVPVDIFWLEKAVVRPAEPVPDPEPIPASPKPEPPAEEPEAVPVEALAAAPEPEQAPTEAPDTLTPVLAGPDLEDAVAELFPRARRSGMKKAEIRAALAVNGRAAIEQMIEGRKV